MLHNLTPFTGLNLLYMPCGKTSLLLAFHHFWFFNLFSFFQSFLSKLLRFLESSEFLLELCVFFGFLIRFKSLCVLLFGFFCLCLILCLCAFIECCPHFFHFASNDSEVGGFKLFLYACSNFVGENEVSRHWSLWSVLILWLLGELGCLLFCCFFVVGCFFFFSKCVPASGHWSSKSDSFQSSLRCDFFADGSDVGHVSRQRTFWCVGIFHVAWLFGLIL